jgi:FKBP-type peptidyl-prolyl cis-trans isomerase FklB
VLPSGLQYRIIQEGTGVTPTNNQNVFIKYRGTFVNGMEFDRADHLVTVINCALKGWAEALHMMRVGSKMQIFVPSDLAYGDLGEPHHHIPPNTALIYEMEMLRLPIDNDPWLGTGVVHHGMEGMGMRPGYQPKEIK